MGKRKHLVVGCGSAALSAVETIRRSSKDDEIKVVSAEKYPPYSPTALPYLLSGRIRESDLWMRPGDYFQKLGVTFETEKRAVEVIPERKEVRYRDGTSDKYDTLLIATGASPAKPAIKGLDEIGFLGFRTLDDYRNLVEQLDGKRRVAILGAGLVAMEVAMGLVEKGYQVDVVARSRVLRAYFDTEAEAFIKDIFRGEGANFVTGQQPTEIRRNGRGIEVGLSNGDAVVADVVITAMGVNPNVVFLEGAGIKVSTGIPVDKSMRTNVPDVFAAGDVAEGPSFFTGEPGSNAILPSAVSQGRIAGAAMAGEEALYEGWIPMNVFNFFGRVAFSVGLSTTTDARYRVLKEVDENRKQFKKLVFDGDRLAGVMFLNVDLDPGLFHYLVRKRVSVEAHAEALFERPRDISRWLMLRNEKRETGLT